MSDDSTVAERAPTTTVMFTDVVDSTGRLVRLGDDAGTAQNLAHLRLAREAITRHQGRVVKTIGDGVMAAFASALAAVDCAVAMQREIHLSTTSDGAIDGTVEEEPWLRVGINAGEITPDASGDVFGLTVVIASRLCAMAEGGQILVSGLVADLVGSRGDHSIESIGELALKGVATPVRASLVGWRSEAVAATPSLPPTPAQLPMPSVLARYAERPLAGRRDSLARLVAEYERVARHERRLFLLAGEPGIGKTRLAAELGRVAHERGATVLYGYCEEQALVPFAPFVTALDYLAGALPANVLRRGLAGRERELARLLPSLPGAPSGSSSSPDESEFERYRLFEAVVALIELAAQRAPIVVVFDDLHWADRETLLLLKHVMRAPRHSDLLVLATYRNELVTGSHPLTHLLADLRRESLWERHQLQGLDLDAVSDLVHYAVGAKVPDSLVRELWEETEGHPFFVHELVRHLSETGVTSSRQLRATIRRTIQRVGLPEGVKEIVSGRVQRLPPATRETLDVAAVIGRTFPAETVGLAHGTSRQDVDRMLEPALSAQLIERVPDTLGEYVFSHSLVREVLYHELPEYRRSALHLQVGRALEDAGAHGGERHLAELAHHYLAAATQGEDHDRGIDFAIAAAAQASLSLAFGKACDHLRPAVEALRRRTDRQRDYCETLLDLGENEWQAGEYLSSRDTYREAAQVAEQLGEAELLARAAIGFGGRIGLQTSAVDEEFTYWLEQAQRALGDMPSRLGVQVTARLAMSLTGSVALQRRLGEQAIDAARALADDALLAEAMFFVGWAWWAPDNLAERLAFAEEVVTLADRSHSLPLRLESRFWRVAHLLEAGEVDRAERDVRTLRELAQEARQPYHLWLVAVLEAMRAMTQQVDETTVDAIWQAFRNGAAAQNSAAMEVFSGQLLVGYGLADRSREFAAAARVMTEHFDSIPLFHAGLALTYCQLDRVDEARPWFERLAADDFAGIRRDWQWLYTMDLLCEICWELTDAAQAATLTTLLTPYAERNVVLGAWAAPRGVLARGLGLLAICRGELDEAVTHLQAAVAANDRLGVQTARISAQLNLAQALLARDGHGDRLAADELFAQTRAEAEQRGLTRIVAVIDAATQPGPSGGSSHTTIRERASISTDAARSALSVRGRGLLARQLIRTSDDDIERRFAHPLAQRALFTALARSFQPRLAVGFEGEIGFELYSKPDDRWHWWTLVVQGGQASARRRAASNPAFLAQLTIADFVRVVAGEHNPVTLWMEQRAVTEGDILIAARLVDMFGGVHLLDELAGNHQLFGRSAD